MRTLVIIAEGIEPTLLHEEIDHGRLPWFADRAAAGAMRPLACGPVPYEPSNLATAFTGLGPGHHGCFSYWASRGGTGGDGPRVLDTADVMAPRLWEMPQFADVRMTVLNVQLTHPPRPMNGALISYPMAGTLRASHPPDLLHRLARDGHRWAHDVTVFYKGQPLEQFAAAAWQAARYQLDVALALADDCDLMIVNLTLPDRLSHFLWHEVEAPRDTADGPGHVRRAYHFVDDACRRLQEHCTGATLVFSEMGFGGLDGFVSLDDHLRRAGLQVLDDDGAIDERRSLARESVQGTHGVLLLAEASGAVEQVREALLSFRFADGGPVLAEARHRDAVYDGPYVSRAPDIVVRPADPRRPPLGDARWATHVRRTSQSGWHRETGFITVDGCDWQASAPETVELTAIAPTIAALMGRELPAAVTAAPVAA